MTLELFPFRYRDPLTGRWVKARYKATRQEIAARHVEWEITGPAEVRSPIGAAFHPYRVVPHAEVTRLQEPSPQMNPHRERPPAIDAGECFLTTLFLRRYVTALGGVNTRRCRGLRALYGGRVATINVLG